MGCEIRAKQKIIWAFDAFSDDLELQSQTAHAIRCHAPDAVIYPVYILSEDAFSAKGFSSFLRAALRPRAKHALEDLLKLETFDICRSQIRAPKILVEKSASRLLCAKKLLRYAKKIDAKFIAIGTHGRRLFSRFARSRFAETLLLESTLPVLVSGPKQLLSRTSGAAVIVPTGFDAAEEEAFYKLLCDAKLSQVSLHLIHRRDCARDSLWSCGLHTWGGGWMPVESFFDESCANERDRASKWLSLARENGVEARLVPENFRESISETIIDYAKKLEGASPLIALLGSCAKKADVRILMRDLIRASPFSLYVSTSSQPGV